MSYTLAAAVFIGGGLGSLIRFLISKLIPFSVASFPFATLISNVCSCVVLAISLYLFREKINSNDFMKHLIIIGFCGGFSTFSTFSYETLELLKNNYTILAVFNVVISVLFCVGIIYLFYKSSY